MKIGGEEVIKGNEAIAYIRRLVEDVYKLIK